jgi:hypothetical protein
LDIVSWLEPPNGLSTTLYKCNFFSYLHHSLLLHIQIIQIWLKRNQKNYDKLRVCWIKSLFLSKFFCINYVCVNFLQRSILKILDRDWVQSVLSDCTAFGYNWVVQYQIGRSDCVQLTALDPFPKVLHAWIKPDSNLECKNFPWGF